MRSVLLVDDSATDRTLVGGLLERAGFAVKFAPDGDAALKHVSLKEPDLVLTDMQMPQMNGLELVQALRKKHPAVPVILMTAHGSEALAAQALRQGAASYVPKTQSNELLVESIEQVLELAQGDRSHKRLIDCTVVTDFQFALDNDPDLIAPLVDLIQQMIAGMDLTDAAGRLQAGIAIEQALLNAIFRGNLEIDESLHKPEHSKSTPAAYLQAVSEPRRQMEPYSSRTCHVRVHVTKDEARIIIRDEGPGFDVKSMLDVSVGDETKHRGLVLMWALMDKVSFSPTGNEVTLIKRSDGYNASQGEDLELADDDTPTSNTEEIKEFGQLVPVEGGGQPIALKRQRLIVGRTEPSDVVLHYSDVSHEHCLLYVYHGWWYVKDLHSVNGVRVDKTKVDQKRVAPGATLWIGPHPYKLEYSPGELGAIGVTPPVDPF